MPGICFNSFVYYYFLFITYYYVLISHFSIFSTERVMTVSSSCFVFNRTVDDKPKRPTRKRQAPEDFLGKGPDRKIFMGKYVM